MQKEIWNFVIEMEVETDADERFDGDVDKYTDMLVEFQTEKVKKAFEKVAAKAIKESGVKARVTGMQLWDEELIGG